MGKNKNKKSASNKYGHGRAGTSSSAKRKDISSTELSPLAKVAKPTDPIAPSNTLPVVDITSNSDVVIPGST